MVPDDKMQYIDHSFSLTHGEMTMSPAPASTESGLVSEWDASTAFVIDADEYEQSRNDPSRKVYLAAALARFRGED